MKVLAGSYDTYNMPAERRAINAALVPAFREKLFQGGGQLTQKFQVLLDAAKGRHFAMYFRDHRLQDAFVAAAPGRRPEHDRPRLPGRVHAEHQRQQVRLLAEADRRLGREAAHRRQCRRHADRHRAEPVPAVRPRVLAGRRPAGPATTRAGRATRSRCSCRRAREIQGQAQIRNLPFKPIVRSVLDRPYFTRKVLLAPQAEAVLQVTYRVPERRHGRRRLARLRPRPSTPRAPWSPSR